MKIKFTLCLCSSLHLRNIRLALCEVSHDQDPPLNYLRKEHDVV